MNLAICSILILTRSLSIGPQMFFVGSYARSYNSKSKPFDCCGENLSIFLPKFIDFQTMYLIDHTDLSCYIYNTAFNITLLLTMPNFLILLSLLHAYTPDTMFYVQLYSPLTPCCIYIYIHS